MIKQGDEQVCDTLGNGDPQPLGLGGGEMEGCGVARPVPKLNSNECDRLFVKGI